MKRFEKEDDTKQHKACSLSNFNTVAVSEQASVDFSR